MGEKYNKNHRISFSHCDWLRPHAVASSLQCCTVWPNRHDEDTLQNGSLFLRNTLKLAFMIGRLEKHLDTYVLMPFDDTTALKRVFHDLHHEAFEKHKAKMATGYTRATVPSLRSSLIEDDLLQFYENLIGFTPQDQWKSMNKRIWSEIQVLFKPYSRKRRKRRKRKRK